jgi:hypothetical protein
MVNNSAVKALREAGNRVITVLAACTGDLIIMEKQMRKLSDGFQEFCNRFFIPDFFGNKKAAA